jgi:hypothetical protein
MATEGQHVEDTAGSFQRVEHVPSMRQKSVTKRRQPIFIAGMVLLIAVIVIGANMLWGSFSANDVNRIQGKVAMSEHDLRAVVKARHLSVYWAGPVAGDKYALVAQKSGQAFVRYLPKGAGLADTTSTFRIIATYVQKGAFLTTQTAGGQVGNVGFTNIDGNSVFYVKTRPTNVYIGIRGKDIQLEVFDPNIDQALAIALFHGQIQPIN